MTPNIEVTGKLFEILGAMSVLAGMAWWQKGSPAEDEIVVEAAAVVLDGLSDADAVSKIGCVTGRDLRSQLTVEEALEMHREAELRNMKNRN